MFAKLLDYLAIRILFSKAEWIKNHMIHKLGMDTTTLAQFKMIENWMNEFDSNSNNTSAIDEMNYKSLYYPTLKKANIDKDKCSADIHTAMAGSIHNTGECDIFCVFFVGLFCDFFGFFFSFFL